MRNAKKAVETTATKSQPVSAHAEAKQQEPDSVDLVRLPEELKDKLAKLGVMIRQTSENARQIGQTLKEVKDWIKSQKQSWEQWVKDHLRIEKRQAQKYMRLADCWYELVADGCDPANMTIEECLSRCAKRD